MPPKVARLHKVSIQSCTQNRPSPKVQSRRLGTFCKTKIAIFVKARDEVRKNGACSRISTPKVRVDGLLREQIFRSRSDFREVNPVVQLVQNGGSVDSFRSTGFASIFFPSRFWTSVMFS